MILLLSTFAVLIIVLLLMELAKEKPYICCKMMISGRKVEHYKT